MLESVSASVIALVVIGFILSFSVAVGIGANDVANSFGSVYGTKSLKLWKIILLSVIFESLGAILIGMKVTDTVRKGIINLSDIQTAYNYSLTCRHPFVVEGNRTLVSNENVVLYCAELLHLLGSVSILFACSISLICANYFKIPASATHVVIGSTLGYGLVALKGQHINWIKLAEIVGSWIVSPVASGIFSALVCFLLDVFMVKRFTRKKSFIIVTILCFLTMFVLLFSIFFKGSPFLKFDKIPDYGVVLISLLGSIIFSCCMRYLLIPYLKRKSGDGVAIPSVNTAGSVESDIQITMVENKKLTNNQNVVPIEGDAISSRMITILQIMTACNKSFAHGGNDVSNSVAPLMSIWLLYNYGALASKTDPIILLLAYGALGMVMGVAIWGHRVMKTIGEDITKITPISGYSIEFSSSSTVLLMTLLGFPVSTTHCTVGSTVAVGWLRYGVRSVKIKLLLSIIICCVVSIPFPAIISASIFCIARAIMFGVK